MKSKKSIIDVYYCDIYNFDLVVANKYATVEQLKKRYKYNDGAELDIDSFLTDSMATTSCCTDKKTNSRVMLVKYNSDNTSKKVDKRSDFINTVSHEAAHVAIDVYYHMLDQALRPDSSEPFCYLQGWAAECIYKTLTK